MAPSGKTPFEIIRGRGDASDRLRVPKWWKGSKHDRSEAESATGESRQTGWFGTPVTFRLNRGMLLGIAAVFGAALVTAYEVGVAQSGGGHAADQSSTEMAAARRQEINARLMRTDDDGTSDANAATTSAGSPDGTTARVTSNDPDAVLSIDAGGPDDPRQPGMHYFCLATMPPKYRAEAEKAVRFLQQNRVDAAIVSVDNRWLQVIALKGFERSTSPQASDYKRLLLALGKAWKAEHRGWSDWNDLYAIKYQP